MLLTCNINVPVYVKLTDLGIKRLFVYYANLHNSSSSMLLETYLPKPDYDGMHKFQLHELMLIFGSEMNFRHGENLFENNQIVFIK